MDIKNLMGKLKTTEQPVQPMAPVVEDNIPTNIPQVQKVIPQIPQPPKAAPFAQPQHFVLPREPVMTNAQEETGVVLDLGEGISLVIPIMKRMSLSDFLKVAEKVKALEMLSEEAEHRGQSPLYER